MEQVLDILEDWLIGRGWGYQRIDGAIGPHSVTALPAPPLMLVKATSFEVMQTVLTTWSS